MQKVLASCAGLDVHKKFVTACCLQTDDQGRTHKEHRTFTTMTSDIEALGNWLAGAQCTQIAIESTGVFWQPIYNLLEERFRVWLVNPQHIKHVPGRKTDVQDAEWLAQLLQHGLLRASFIPNREQRELRELLRHRQSLVEERNRITNRIQKLLEDANIKLASVATDLQGVSAQAILHALLRGETDPHQLAGLARGVLRTKRTELEQALRGGMRPHHRFLLAHLLAQLDFLDEEIALVEARIEEQVDALPGFRQAILRLSTIPGVKHQTALLIVAEIGIDMSRFPTDRHLTSWAGLVPGNNQSGGKQRPARTRQGNRFLRRGLVQAARAAARSKGTYLQALYHRLAPRRGTSRAAVAVARTILQMAYYLLSRGDIYHELGAEYLDRLDRERTTHRLVRRLEHLGYHVQLTEPEITPTG
jgi:transposase